MSNFNEPYYDGQGHPPSRDELIDFPVSNTFARHYFDKGYSTVKPPRPKTRQASNEENLKRKVDALATEVAGLHGTVQALIREVRASKNISRRVHLPAKQTPNSTVAIGITDEELERVGTHG